MNIVNIGSGHLHLFYTFFQYEAHVHILFTININISSPINKCISVRNYPKRSKYVHYIMFCRLLLCFCGFGPGLAQTRVLSHQSGHKIRKVNADWIFRVLTLNQQDADPWNSYCAAHPYPFF